MIVHSPKNGPFSETQHIVFAVNQAFQKGSLLQRFLHKTMFRKRTGVFYHNDMIQHPEIKRFTLDKIGYQE